MSNGTVESVGPTPPPDGPVDVHEAQVQQAVQDAKKKAEELVKDLADIVTQHQGPPGTPSLRRK